MIKHIHINPNALTEPTRDRPSQGTIPRSLPEAETSHLHPSRAGNENASIFFVGTATTILEWSGIRIMTDPNFLHAGDHVHLGPGVTGTRKTNPAVDLHDLPRVDLILLSHYHADHFDQDVEASLRRDIPIITTPHAKAHLGSKPGDGEAFTAVTALDEFESAWVNVDGSAERGKRAPVVKVTGMPGKHVPPGALDTVNDLLKAVPPTNGWMVELGFAEVGADDADFLRSFECGYRMYISGDTLMVPELQSIPKYLEGQPVDLMLVHLGGTTIPSPSIPLLMVTMDAKQGLELVRLIRPDVTMPIHYDDYDVFLSPLDDFKKVMEEAGLKDKVVYLDRGDEYRFQVAKNGGA